ncbi:hypothetical protein [Lacicoccus alkaliphilus]|uniref:Uncharacterized protein n=1 Tax=Lacicoccus alkaliphilus DSM 16010 TaxID=1123231 RepID=A0A1M7BLK8_9BACL|nr:hypothetical protein [Salinicoccus alkaliphilus]SHL55938.1 hypothetical protein SAMN02745189_00504 [Salinicoccus alkaliphilus DSM 16010]
MEVLLPLLIFAGGVIYSIIASTGNKNEEKRDIDPGKMERPGRSAPRPRQSESDTGGRQSQGSGGMFDELKREFQSEYEKAMGRTGTDTSAGPPERPSREDVKRRVEEERRKLEERRQREKKETSMRERSRRETSRDRKPVERKQSERAERARERVRTGAADSNVEVAKPVEGVGSEITDELRYSYGDDRTSVADTRKSSAFSSKDLTFDNKAIVNGVIFNEILGKPKSRK